MGPSVPATKKGVPELLLYDVVVALTDHFALPVTNSSNLSRSLPGATVNLPVNLPGMVRSIVVILLNCSIIVMLSFMFFTDICYPETVGTLLEVIDWGEYNTYERNTVMKVI